MMYIWYKLLTVIALLNTVIGDYSQLITESAEFWASLPWQEFSSRKDLSFEIF